MGDAIGLSLKGSDRILRNIEEKPIAYQNGFLFAKVLDLLDQYSNSYSEILDKEENRALLGELKHFLVYSLKWIEFLDGVSGRETVSPEMMAMFNATSLFCNFILGAASSRGDSSLDGTYREIQEMISILEKISERKAGTEEVARIKKFLSDYADPLLDELKGMVGVGQDDS